MIKISQFWGWLLQISFENIIFVKQNQDGAIIAHNPKFQTIIIFYEKNHIINPLPCRDVSDNGSATQRHTA